VRDGKAPTETPLAAEIDPAEQRIQHLGQHGEKLP
jgi:hypothetical protein